MKAYVVTRSFYGVVTRDEPTLDYTLAVSRRDHLLSMGVYDDVMIEEVDAKVVNIENDPWRSGQLIES